MIPMGYWQRYGRVINALLRRFTLWGQSDSGLVGISISGPVWGGAGPSIEPDRNGGRRTVRAVRQGGVSARFNDFNGLGGKCSSISKFANDFNAKTGTGLPAWRPPRSSSADTTRSLRAFSGRCSNAHRWGVSAPVHQRAPAGDLKTRFEHDPGIRRQAGRMLASLPSTEPIPASTPEPLASAP
jgi:hypothetical protein